MPNILLIDDIDKNLAELRNALQRVLPVSEAEIREWVPAKSDQPAIEFDEKVDGSTILVVTDYDLTKKGQTGLFGSTIVGWCQKKVIPVGDFSRGNRDALPKEPNQYEIRVPTDPDAAAVFIAGVYRGFHSIQTALSDNWPTISKKKSPVAALAAILDRTNEENRLALYGSKLGTANAALIEQIAKATPADKDPADDEKRRLLGYVVGHLLLNVILRFPGPILNKRALAAYLAMSVDEVWRVQSLFESARYKGPFCAVEEYYWFSDIDTVLDDIARAEPSDSAAETIGQLNREAVERKLGIQLRRHNCPRCNGQNGGYLCPFTQKTVCQLGTCSVNSNAWIPQGARLCRIEKEFYDEWAPMLGF